jgi:hypothetical protein
VDSGTDVEWIVTESGNKIRLSVLHNVLHDQCQCAFFHSRVLNISNIKVVCSSILCLFLYLLVEWLHFGVAIKMSN